MQAITFIAFLSLVAFVFLCPSDAALVSTIDSTVAANGDQNPYGVAIALQNFSDVLQEGDVLVSNFNNAANQQGTGTTIMRFPRGAAPATLWAHINASQVQCTGGIGLTTALVILKTGFVIVGSLPTLNGTFQTARSGCLILLNSRGIVVSTFEDGINGPWDATLGPHPTDRNKELLFVTNILNGNVTADGPHPVNLGTVVRFEVDEDPEGKQPPRIHSGTIIGTGFGQMGDPVDLLFGPTGMGLDGETLFVVDRLYNRIAAIPDARQRSITAYAGEDVTANRLINKPLGLFFDESRGTIFSANAGDSYIVETAVDGRQLNTFNTTVGADGLFGIALAQDGSIFFVDNNTNTLKRLILL